MKLDFENLKAFADKLSAAYEEDIPASYNERHVYSLEFYPHNQAFEVRTHVAWPMFRELVDSNQAAVDISVVHSQMTSLHVQAKIQGVLCVDCVFMHELRHMFEDLGLPDEEHPINFDDDIRNLFNLWQNLTGWGLNTTTKEALYE